MKPTLQSDSRASSASCGLVRGPLPFLQTWVCLGLLCCGLSLDAQQDLTLVVPEMRQVDSLRLQAAQDLAASMELESSSACAEHALTRAMRRSLNAEFSLIDPLRVYPSGRMHGLGHVSRPREPIDQAEVLYGLIRGSVDQWAENSLVFSLDTHRLRLDMEWGLGATEHPFMPLDVLMASCQEQERLTQSWLSTHFRDFYFKNEEVTNREYREFTDWVKDSIVRNCLESALPARTFPPIGPVPFQDKAVQQALFDHGLIFALPDSASSAFLDWNNQAWTCSISGQTLCVYPDTLCWVRSFFGGNEMLSSNYFWHPAFDDYPVVGVTWLQTQAFLRWKENQINAAWNKAGLAARVTLRLPEFHEWILAHSHDPRHFGAVDQHKAHAASARGIRMFLDFDLAQFDSNPDANGQDRLTRDSPLQELLHGDERLLGDFLVDGALYTQSVHSSSWSEIALHQVEGHPAHHSLLRNKQRAQPGPIHQQSGNVSEWLHNGMTAWNGHCHRFLAELDDCELEESEILRAMFERQQRHFDGMTDGKLVVGANWFDERLGMSPGGILPGALAKNFVEATNATATLGFRYVMHLSPSPSDLIVP